jgi:hypothetical protein
MKSLKEINIKDGEIVLQPEVVEPKVLDFDPEKYNEIELERCAEMVKGLLESNWRGIQKSIHDNPECRTSVSINLSLNHSTSDSRYAKAKIAFAVKTSDEAEICVPNPNQMEMF